MIDLDQVVVRRAEEQVRSLVVDRRHEKDSWAIAGDEPAPPHRARPSACKAAGCPRPPRSSGYCHTHNRRLARGLPIDWEPEEPGRRCRL